MPTTSSQEKCWFVMRDLKRPNAKMPAYRQLAEEGFDVFTPFETKIVQVRGKKVKITVPIIRDLLFVHATREELDPTVRRTDTLQYRYKKGAYCEPIVVPAEEMEQFMRVVNSGEEVKYYRPEEITQRMFGAKIRIQSSGPLNGAEGHLLSVRGSRKRRLIVRISGVIAAVVEVTPEYIQLI